MAVLGGIANGTFANLGNENIDFYIGFFGGMAALLIFGILNLVKKTDTHKSNPHHNDGDYFYSYGSN